MELEAIFAEAKAEVVVRKEGWRTLEASVVDAGRRMRHILEEETRPDGVEVDLTDSNSGLEATDKDDLDTTDHDDYLLQNGYNVSDAFRRYHSKSMGEAEKARLFVDSNLHEIVALNHALLLKSNEHSEEMIEIFGLHNLQALHTALLEKYLTPAKMDEDIIVRVLLALRDLSKSRRLIKEEINDIAKAANDMDYKLLDILKDKTVGEPNVSRILGNKIILERNLLQ